MKEATLRDVILLIDRSNDCRTLFKEMLENDDRLICITVANLIEAVASYKNNKNRVNFVFINISDLGIHSCTVAQKIRRLNKNIKIIGITTNIYANSQNCAYFDRFVIKPYGFSDVISCLS